MNTNKKLWYKIKSYYIWNYIQRIIIWNWYSNRDFQNILEKFNPGARQLISAGKAYLKALHGAASASRIFNEALVKIAANAQQGGTTDIGKSLKFYN